MTDLRYPIGRFIPDADITDEKIAGWIKSIEMLPEKLARVVSDLTDAQLDTPYRPEGWTVRQLVHHLADSHINSYVRFRLVLTEENPLIKTYDEKGWAELEDAKTDPIQVSLDLLTPLHRRWTELLRTLEDQDWKRTFRHPELGELNLLINLQIYAWHGDHHVAHITALRERMKW